MIIDRRAANVVLEMVEEKHFFKPRNRQLFTAFSEMLAQVQEIDELTIRAELERRGVFESLGGAEYIDELVMAPRTAANVETYCQIVLKTAQQRATMEAAGRLLQAAQAGNPADMERAARVAVEVVEPIHPKPANGMDAEIDAEISGARYSVPFCRRPCLSQTQALLPGTLTVLCGSPGASKSMFSCEDLWRWFYEGENVASMQLEKGVDFHFRRILAQMAQESWLTNALEVRARASDALSIRQHFSRAIAEMREAGLVQSRAAGQTPTAGFLLNWMSREIDRGRRVLLIDPITYMSGGEKRYLDQERFIDGARNLVDRKGVSLILVSHPKDGKPGEKVVPMLENVKGSKSFQMFTDTVIWLEAHNNDTMDFQPVNPETGKPYPPTTHRSENKKFNRTIHILKKRLGPTESSRIAYYMDGSSLWHVECGWL